MARKRLLASVEFDELCARIDAGEATRDDLKRATWHLLELLAAKAPGNSVEVRVPPFAVIQVIAGARHTRGTPPAVVEMKPETWIALARGNTSWAEAKPSASGERSDISGLLPLVP